MTDPATPPLRRCVILEVCQACREPLDHRHEDMRCAERAGRNARRERARLRAMPIG